MREAWLDQIPFTQGLISQVFPSSASLALTVTTPPGVEGRERRGEPAQPLLYFETLCKDLQKFETAGPSATKFCVLSTPWCPLAISNK